MKTRMTRIIVIWIVFCVLLCNTESVNSAKQKWPSGPKNITAASAIVMELNTGVILYGKNIHEKQYPASITKIMTTLLSLENCSLSDTVTFSKEAVNGIEIGSSNIGVVAGEKLNMQDCLYGIMLMSANEVCLGVAEHIAGSEEKFVKMMNRRAKDLGCKGTHFANPHGLFDKNHYTTAYDMALISSAAMKNSVFRKITGTKRYDIPKTNKNDKINALYNKQQMLYPIKYPKYGYPYCTGGKTGYTDLARWTLVTFAKKDGMELVCVVMRTDGPPPGEPNEYTDSISLLNFAFENYKIHDISGTKTGAGGEDHTLFTNYNHLFDKERSPLRLENNAGIVLPNKAKRKDAIQNIEYYSDIVLREGSNTIGRVSYTYGGKQVGASAIIYDTTQVQAQRLVGSEPVTDIMEEIVQAEQIQQEKEQRKEENKGNRWNIWSFIGIGVGVLLIITVGIILIVRIRKEKKVRRYRFYHKRTKKRRDKGLHF